MFSIKIKRSYLIACLIIVAFQLLAVNCKVKSRGNLEYHDNPEENSAAASSSYSFNGQPLFQYRNLNNNNLAVEAAVNQYEHLHQQQQEQEQSQPVLSRNRNKMMNFDVELEKLKHELEGQQSSVEQESNNLPMARDKKSRPLNVVAKDKENEPISNHGRKTYVASGNPDNENAQTCSSRLQPKQNMIIDSETSMKRGAKFLGVDYISNQMTIITISGMHDACKQKCCEKEKCDTSLLQMKMGENGYRCYLYQCSDLCNFVQHKDYVVFMAKDEEQSQILRPEQQNQPSPTDDITTGHERHDSHNFEMDSISMKTTTVIKNIALANLDVEDRNYFLQRENTSKTSIALAVTLLVLGIMLVISFFGYLILSTKFVSKRLSCLKKKKAKNVDVDEDYLINGMYL